MPRRRSHPIGKGTYLTSIETTASVASMPRIGDAARPSPHRATQGQIGSPPTTRASGSSSSPILPTSTPVCTSEFMTFATMKEQFAAYHTELVGLSVDGLYSHIAWLRTIKDKITFRGMKDVDVTFPLIEDVSMEIARKYGMIMPGEDSTKAVRAVFVIDPTGTIRAIIYYPLSLGRNFDELLRVVQALQTADHFAVATPADWRPGDRVIVPPAGSCGTAKERMEGHVDGVECEDWFFCTKEIPAQEVESAIRGG